MRDCDKYNIRKYITEATTADLGQSDKVISEMSEVTFSQALDLLVSAYRRSVSSIASGEGPSNVLLFGLPGVGKTALENALMKRLESGSNPMNSPVKYDLAFQTIQGGAEFEVMGVVDGIDEDGNIVKKAEPLTTERLDALANSIRPVVMFVDEFNRADSASQNALTELFSNRVIPAGKKGKRVCRKLRMCVVMVNPAMDCMETYTIAAQNLNRFPMMLRVVANKKEAHDYVVSAVNEYIKTMKSVASSSGFSEDLVKYIEAGCRRIILFADAIYGNEFFKFATETDIQAAYNGQSAGHFGNYVTPRLMTSLLMGAISGKDNFLDGVVFSGLPSGVVSLIKNIISAVDDSAITKLQDSLTISEDDVSDLQEAIIDAVDSADTGKDIQSVPKSVLPVPDKTSDSEKVSNEEETDEEDTDEDDILSKIGLGD